MHNSHLGIAPFFTNKITREATEVVARIAGDETLVSRTRVIL